MSLIERDSSKQERSGKREGGRMQEQAARARDEERKKSEKCSIVPRD